ncbi:MAG: hypothetical protein V3V41_07900 [Candidatus Heimdallarchaeota archaeon]
MSKPPTTKQNMDRSRKLGIIPLPFEMRIEEKIDRLEKKIDKIIAYIDRPIAMMTIPDNITPEKMEEIKKELENL